MNLKWFLCKNKPRQKSSCQSKEQEEISLVQGPSDLDREDLKVGDIVELKSNGTHYKVIGIDDLGFVQCEPIKKSIFDSFKAFKRGEIKKV